VLTDAGCAELLSAFPATTRTLEPTRKLPASARESRPEDDRANDTGRPLGALLGPRSHPLGSARRHAIPFS